MLNPQCCPQPGRGKHRTFSLMDTTWKTDFQTPSTVQSGLGANLIPVSISWENLVEHCSGVQEHPSAAELCNCKVA